MRGAAVVAWIMGVSVSINIGVNGEDRQHARSAVITQGGIVATSHTLASQAGAQILARGGSAADAAIAANAVLGVTEPMMDGIGGDLFVLYWDNHEKKLYGLNASGWSPKAMTRETLESRGIKGGVPISGIHAVTVPGCVDGWAKMHAKFGKLPWKDLFGASIHYAEQGYPVPELIASFWNGSRRLLETNEESRRVLLPGGKPPETGQLFRNPDIGRAMRLIASQGRDAFYRGDIAKAILRTSEKLGGTMAAPDLAEYQSEWVEPISTTYRGWTVSELPPNGQGIAALVMLNIMEQFEASKTGPLSPEELHKKIEAMKLAYADLRPNVADPRTFRSPVNGLLSKSYAKERAALIQPDRANCAAQPGRPSGSDTTYLTVVDKDGNIASWIQSVSAAFGSGVTVEGMGFILQNRGGTGFDWEAGAPNVVAGRKRPFHTIIPGFMSKGEQRIGFGIMGGPNQPLAHAQFVSYLADYGYDLQAAMEAPRFTKAGPSGCDVLIESRAGNDTIERLSEMGHAVERRGAYSTRMGRGQAVMHDAKTKTNWGASDARADGSAEPEPPPAVNIK